MLRLAHMMAIFVLAAGLMSLVPISPPSADTAAAGARSAPPQPRAEESERRRRRAEIDRENELELAPMRRFSAEQREHVIAVVGDLRPLSDQDKERLRQMPRDQFQRLMRQNAGKILTLARLRQQQPQLYEYKIQDLLLDRDAQKVARRVAYARRTSDADAAVSAEEELRELVRQQIELQFETRDFEIDRLERRIALMRLELQDDQMHRLELIEDRVGGLQRQAWETMQQNMPQDEDSPGAARDARTDR